MQKRKKLKSQEKKKVSLTDKSEND